MTIRRWHLSEIPLLFPAVGVAAGIAAVYSAVGPWWGIGLTVLAVCGLGLLLRRARLTVFALSVMTGVLAGWLYRPGQVKASLDVELTGEVIRADNYGTTQRIIVDSGEYGRILVTVSDYLWRIEPGDRVAVRGLLLPPVRIATVPDENDGSGFALRNYLSGRCVPAEGEFRVTADRRGWRGWFSRRRGALLSAIRNSGLSAGASAFLSAVLLGENEAVSDDTKADFAEAGLSHMLALSGTHVSIVALLISVILFPVVLTGGGRIRLLLTIVALWGYAFLTGLSPSVVRAVVMATFILIGKLSGRYPSSLNSLCGACIALLLFDPASLFSPGFQLSFVAVAGILMVVPAIMERVDLYPVGRNIWIRAAIGAVALPVAAVVATAPLSAYYFHRFPLWFLVANLPAAVLLPVLLAGGVLLLLIKWLTIPGGLLVSAVDGIYSCIERCASWTAGLPGNDAASGLYFPAWVAWGIYAGMLLLWLGWNMRRKVLVVDGGIVLLASVALAFVARPGYPERECYPWHDGMAVNLLCREGERVVILTDASEKHTSEIRWRAEQTLVDYLDKRHLRIDSVVTRGKAMTLGEMLSDSVSWRIGDKRYFLVRDEEYPPVAGREDVTLIVTSGFKGDVVEVAECYPGRRLVLSPALPPQRRLRYALRLQEVGIPYSLEL